MFTLCPKCALTLVVTAADLRVAQGYVRCGRCLNVFNALSRLSEERPTPPPGSPPEFPSESPPESAPESAAESAA
ncbi:MAG: MJ0042-type zinc finger domain-containing protein [Steroidobacteraceae bacterium]